MVGRKEDQFAGPNGLITEEELRNSSLHLSETDRKSINDEVSRNLCYYFPLSLSAAKPFQFKLLNFRHRASFFLRSYSAEVQAQLSPELLNIMEQRLSAIEYMTASFNNFLNQEIDGLKSLIAECSEDKDMLNMATEEIGQAVEEERRLQNFLLKSLLPKDDADDRDCILEVRPGTGGEEASLFAMDIFRMYEKYALKNGWKFEVVDIAQSDLKGYNEASAAIAGVGVFGKLKFESGIHRVQSLRILVTEKSGCINTNAVSVAILPQADEVDVQLKHEDLRIDTYRSGGSGGQHANTTNSAVRVTHIPTGTMITIQDECSQHMASVSKYLARKACLWWRLELHFSLQTFCLSSPLLILGFFPQGRVTDHTVGITYHSVDDVMQGENLDSLMLFYCKKKWMQWPLLARLSKTCGFN
ncbi:Peptide chain release factor 1 [Glycine soja]|nr:Peptide chain release factor 1 [Glycine soja]